MIGLEWYFSYDSRTRKWKICGIKLSEWLKKKTRSKSHITMKDDTQIIYHRQSKTSYNTTWDKLKWTLHSAIRELWGNTKEKLHITLAVIFPSHCKTKNKKKKKKKKREKKISPYLSVLNKLKLLDHKTNENLKINTQEIHYYKVKFQWELLKWKYLEFVMLAQMRKQERTSTTTQKELLQQNLRFKSLPMVN